MVKIVYNCCYGGFSLSLSHEAVLRYAAIKGLKIVTTMGGDWHSYTLDGEYWDSRDIPRNDLALAQVVEELGAKADGLSAELRIRELPAGTLYRIDEYDGSESVVTVDEYEWSIA